MLLILLLPLNAEDERDHEEDHHERNHHEEWRDEGLEDELSKKELQFEIMRQESNFKMEQRMHEIELQKHELELQQMGKELNGHFGEMNIRQIVLILALVTNLLLAIWVYLDAKSREASAGLWIAIVLLSGVFGAIPYVLVRLGDLREA